MLTSNPTRNATSRPREEPTAQPRAVTPDELPTAPAAHGVTAVRPKQQGDYDLDENDFEDTHDPHSNMMQARPAAHTSGTNECPTKRTCVLLTCGTVCVAVDSSLYVLCLCGAPLWLLRGCGSS